MVIGAGSRPNHNHNHNPTANPNHNPSPSPGPSPSLALTLTLTLQYRADDSAFARDGCLRVWSLEARTLPLSVALTITRTYPNASSRVRSLEA